jgi:NADP-dependent 3-hydroxy acid dehydrogenase YdfG
MILENKVAVVTGASSGLGEAFSAALTRKGATVFGLARRTDRLDEIRTEIGPSFIPLECDVSDESAVNEAFESVHRDGRSVDILINNAGLGKFGPIEDMSTEDWDTQNETNLRGVFLCTRAVIPDMKKRNAETGFGGHIINISSVAGLIGNPMVSAYNATKFGLKGFSEALMKELREDGIKVTCLYPGSVQTEFFEVANVPISARPMTSEDITSTVLHVLEAPDNYLISEIAMRPLRPKG